MKRFLCGLFDWAATLLEAFIFAILCVPLVFAAVFFLACSAYQFVVCVIALIALLAT